MNDLNVWTTVALVAAGILPVIMLTWHHGGFLRFAAGTMLTAILALVIMVVSQNVLDQMLLPAAIAPSRCCGAACARPTCSGALLRLRSGLFRRGLSWRPLAGRGGHPFCRVFPPTTGASPAGRGFLRAALGEPGGSVRGGRLRRRRCRAAGPRQRRQKIHP
jgi:hypothetical protein